MPDVLPTHAADRATIALSEEEREVILDNLWMWDGEGEVEALPFAERGQALATLAALQRAFELRDELAGWPDENPRPRGGAASVTPELVELLRVAHRHAAAALPDEQENLRGAEAGERALWYADTLSATVAAYERNIRRYERERDACAAVLARLGIPVTSDEAVTS